MRILCGILGGFVLFYISFTHGSSLTGLWLMSRVFCNNLLRFLDSFVRAELTDKTFKSFPRNSIRRKLFPFIHSFFTVHAYSLTDIQVKSTLKSKKIKFF